MIMRLALPLALREQLSVEARSAFPHECCGLIEGIREGEVARALKLHPTANLSERPDSFKIDPAAHLRFNREARAAGREIIGCYHSHPRGRPAPSARDRMEEGSDSFLWLIAALKDGTAAPDFAAFVGADFRPLSLVDA